MKKIAVCLPSFNEADNIENTTIIVDKGLSKYKNMNYEVIIVNVDNSSKDGTIDVFKNTTTKCEKLAISTDKPGKGINLLTFFQYCSENSIDYAITIDSDVKSIKPDWIDKYLDPLLNGFDYVIPIYKRMRYEGSTTNHFAYPLISIINGEQIRQPIAGDFAFNKKFIELVLKYQYNKSIEKYGIDIFMTLIACSNKLKIKQIRLPKKLHNPSFSKIEGMFEEVLDGFLFTWKQIYNSNCNFSLDEYPFNSNNNCILRNRKFPHKENAKLLFNKYISVFPNLTKKKIQEKWIEYLYEILVYPSGITEDDKEKIISLFIIRATSFWLESEKSSADVVELRINKQLNNLICFLKKEKKNEKFNN